MSSEVLEALGWSTLRIWSPDWTRDPGVEVARVLSRVEEIRFSPEPEPADETTSAEGLETALVEEGEAPEEIAEEAREEGAVFDADADEIDVEAAVAALAEELVIGNGTVPGVAAAAEASTGDEDDIDLDAEPAGDREDVSISVEAADEVDRAEAPADAKSPDVSEMPTRVEDVTPVGLPEYVEYVPAPDVSTRTSEAFLAARTKTEGEAIDTLIGEIVNVVEAEGPIHIAALSRRLATVFAISRGGMDEAPSALTALVQRLSSLFGGSRGKTPVREIVEHAVEVAASRRIVRVEGEFVSSSEGRAAQPRRRANIEQQPIQEVSAAEISEAVEALLRRHYGMPTGGLALETARVVGDTRTDTMVKRRVAETLLRMAESGVVVEQAGEWVMTDDRIGVAEAATAALSIDPPSDPGVEG